MLSDFLVEYGTEGIPIPDVKLDGWAQHFHLTQGGHCPDWVSFAVRYFEEGWRAFHPVKETSGNSVQERPTVSLDWGPYPPYPAFKSCDQNMIVDPSRLNLPPLSWSPLTPTTIYDPNGKLVDFRKETRPEAEQRMIAVIKAELDRIEREAQERGAEPVPKHNDEHFQWAIRFQVGGESIRAIAGSEDRTRTIRAAVHDILALLGLDRREDKGGRPRRGLPRQQTR